ncbi:MAG: hypothetical protein M3198_13845 [Actinomycetota bacterium]|nr:hypothetical protein [Actinomycetota bacterium]
MDPKDRIEAVVKTKVGAQQEKGASGSEPAPGSHYELTQGQVEAIIEDWPPAPKKIVPETIKKYGLPNEASPTMLIWHDSGPWKRTIITSDETAHDFPTPHTDYISQTINYDVPVEKLPEVAQFDGSLIVYRTAGQVTASCDNEPANFLAINLLHDIVTGAKTADEARHEFGEQTAAWMLNREAPYTEGVRFTQPNESDTGYRDEPVMKEPTLHQTVEKVKDVLGVGDKDS